MADNLSGVHCEPLGVWTQGVWVCIFWVCSTLSKADGVDVFNGKNLGYGYRDGCSLSVLDDHFFY